MVEVKPKEYVAYPGLYGPNFDFDTISDVNPAGTLKLYKGIYCFYDGIDLQSTWDITTDWNNNDQHDSLSEGVFFFVPGGDISFNGSSTLNLHAVDSSAENFPEDFVNYLMYVPPTIMRTSKSPGPTGPNLPEPSWPPHHILSLNGGTGTVGLNSQVIGYAVTIEGNGTLDIHYNQDDNGLTTKNPGIEQTE